MWSKRAIAFSAVLLISGAAVAGLSARGEPKRRLHYEVTKSAQVVTAPELAKWIIEGRRDFAVVDLRAAPAFQAGHVKDAVHCGKCHENAAEGRKALAESVFVDLSKKLVLYTETGSEPVELPKLLAKNPRLYLLRGGYQAWKAEVLAPVVFGGETDAEQLRAKQQKEAVRAYFAGERPQSGKAAVLPVTPIRRDNAHKPAGAHEGC
ncbi:MAG: hypothetical protein HS104_39870 [Polyangiaceae bacterium]|nr:hypothetical protein [Polyangiaceae bacterium]MCL4749478.1 hypothetical protein [Myxococcales bacterium]